MIKKLNFDGKSNNQASYNKKKSKQLRRKLFIGYPAGQMDGTPSRSLRSATPSPKVGGAKTPPISELTVASSAKSRSVKDSRKRKEEEEDDLDSSTSNDDSSTNENPSKKARTTQSDIEFNREERKYVKMKVRSGDTITSPCWSSKLCQMVNLTKEGIALMKKVNARQRYTGLRKIHEKKAVAICKICFDNERIPLKKAVIPTYRYQPGNANNHLITQHTKEEAPEFWEKYEEKSTGPIVEVEKKKKESSKQAKIQTQSTIPEFSSGEDVVKKCNELLYQFFNSANISINQANNVYLNELLRTLVDYSHHLKFRRQQICFSPWRYKVQECFTFNTFAMFLTTAVSSAREHYKETTGKRVAFITVSHDAWDSKRRDMIGCCIHFVHPVYWINVSLPVGLKYLTSKKSVGMVEQLNKILVRYNIEKEDIYRGVNDTTNSALLTGRLLSSGRNKNNVNTCQMHTQELVVTHALGIRTRKRGGQVVDSFEQGKSLRDKVKNLLSFIMDRKAKGRFREYCIYCSESTGTKGLVLELPNDTRVAGTYRMFLSCLRSKKAITQFGTVSSHADKMTDLLLTRNEWNVLSEVEAVLKECHDLAMNSQMDCVGSNSFSYYAVRECKDKLKNADTFELINVKENYSPSTTRNELKKITYERERLSETATQLLNRLDKEFQNYFGTPDEDQLLSMFFHPFFVWNGYERLKILDPENFDDSKISIYVQQAESFVQELYDKQYLIGFQDENNNNTSNDNEEGKQELSNIELLSKLNVDHNTRMMYARLLKSKTTDSDAPAMEINIRDQEALNRKKNEIKSNITNAVNDYVFYCKNKMDALSTLKLYKSEFHIKNSKKLDEIRVNPPFRDAFYAFRFFDVLKWWEGIGRARWPILATAASIVLGKPSHNGFQERVFSRGTYFDNPLKQRMKEENFEKSVLNSLTQGKVKDLLTELPEIIIPQQKYEVNRQQIDSFFEKENHAKEIINQKMIGIDEDNEAAKNEATTKEESSEDEVSVDEDIISTMNKDIKDIDLTNVDDETDELDALSVMTSMEKEDANASLDDEDN